MAKRQNVSERSMLRLLAKMRAQGARQYSSAEAHRIIYRDGFTDGWEARDEIAREGTGEAQEAQGFELRRLPK